MIRKTSENTDLLNSYSRRNVDTIRPWYQAMAIMKSNKTDD